MTARPRPGGPRRRGGAVLGSPIAHSLSPVLHRAAYDALGLDGWSYRAVECGEADLARTLGELDAEGLAGVSLTMPLKKAVLPLLGSVESLAGEVGAANTVLFGAEPGEWTGANTDVPGLVAALRRQLPQTPASDSDRQAADVRVEGRRSMGASAPRSAAVLGAGATAASALAALRELGAATVEVFARRPEAAGELRAAAERVGVEAVLRPFGDAAAGVRRCELVVATTPAGSTDELAATLGAGLAPDDGRGSDVPGLGVLFDVVYAPWPTRLAEAWAAAGGRVIGGIELLVEQAALQVELMTGRTAPVEAMRAAGLAARRPTP